MANRSAQNYAGDRLIVIDSTSPTEVAMNGGWAFRNSDGAAYYHDLGASAVPAGSVFLGGLAFSPSGVLQATTNTGGSFTRLHGMAVRNDGALLISKSAPAASDPTVSGWKLNPANGALYVIDSESLFTSQTPATTGNDNTQYEMGIKLQFSVAGRILGVRFWHPTGGTPGSYIGKVWSAGGTLLASTNPITTPVVNGWNTIGLPAPLAVAANTTYVVSVNIGPDKTYPFTGSGLVAQITNGNVKSVADGNNGVFANTPGTFPNTAVSSANYWRDVLFAGA